MAQAINSEAVNDRVKLYQRLNNMSEDERGLFTKIIFYTEITNLLNALENMKSTSVETWKRIIKRFKSLKDMGLSFDDFDLGKFCEKLLPLIGAAAGLFLALKESGDRDTESSDAANIPDPEDETSIDLVKLNEEISTQQKAKSLILQYCNENIKGFSI
jgi:hypothetical protein